MCLKQYFSYYHLDSHFEVVGVLYTASCRDSRAKTEINLGKENILNDSEAKSSAFQWQKMLLYFALEKSSPHRAL